MQPVIAIPAYNRPKALERLLRSLAMAEYPNRDVQLFIGIDAGGKNHAAVVAAAERFEWEFGRKTIIQHPHNVGLIDNIFFCARLSQQFGSVILLEDDLFVGAQFYNFASAALNHYEADARIAGISLNDLWFNGYTKHRFEPRLDGNDVYFMQVAWYDGIAFTGAMWRALETWLNAHRGQTSNKVAAVFNRFAATEWFPDAMRYLAETDRYFVFPRDSHSSNFGDAGTHFSTQSSLFQTQLASVSRPWRMPELVHAQAIYDGFHELNAALAQRLLQRQITKLFSVDLNGLKQLNQFEHDLVLTIRPSRRPLRTWGLHMRPPYANVYYNIKGSEIALSHVTDLEWRPSADRAITRKLRRFHDRPTRSLRYRLRAWTEDKWLDFGRT